MKEKLLGTLLIITIFVLGFIEYLLIDNNFQQDPEATPYIVMDENMPLKQDYKDELLYKQQVSAAKRHEIQKEKKREEEKKKKQEEELAAAASAPPITQVSSSTYPIAAEIWNYLRNCGYSNSVCAGIIGNMMVEAGGGTLAIQPVIYGSGFYGICQWNQAYGSVWETDLYTQLNFLMSNIVYELNTFGYAYYSGFGYNSFCGLGSPEEAALAFAKCYERCGSGSYGWRQSCARTAYNYFVG